MLPCAVLFLRACSLRSFPSCRFPWGFPVTGCLSFCFPGDVGWASALPFFFCASPALLACRGRRGYAPLCQGAPVAVVSAWFEGEVTLLPFPYLRVGVLLACGVSGVCGLRRRSRLPFYSWFVTALGSWTAYSGTCCFLEPYLGFFPLASSVGCWLEVVEVYPWLSSLRSFAVEGVTWFFVRYLLACPHGAAVPLDSWVRWCSYSSC